MLRIFHKDETNTNKKILNSMYALRARVFGERLKWQVEITDGYEKDYFDEIDPLYVVYLDANENVIATFRLLPTTGPTMLRDIFSRCLPSGMDIKSPLIWESTRFAVDSEFVKNYGDNGLSRITGEMLSALIQIGVSAGLTHIVTVIDVRMEKILLRAGCPVDRLADPVDYGGTKTLAILMECTEEWVSLIQQKNKIGISCVNEQYKTLIAA